jgi:DNA-binding protein H-NS
VQASELQQAELEEAAAAQQQLLQQHQQAADEAARKRQELEADVGTAQQQLALAQQQAQVGLPPVPVDGCKHPLQIWLPFFAFLSLDILGLANSCCF